MVSDVTPLPSVRAEPPPATTVVIGTGASASGAGAVAIGSRIVRLGSTAVGKFLANVN
jgi:hypothetical protein